MVKDLLDAIHRGQSRAVHILAGHNSEVGRPRNGVGQLGGLAARKVILLQDGVGPEDLPGPAGNQPCPLL